MQHRNINLLKPERPNTTKQDSKSSKKITGIAVAFFVVVLMIWGITAAFGQTGHFSLKNILIPSKGGVVNTVSTILFSTDENLTKLIGHDEDRINILLLGIGGPGHDGAYLSDTIILASIKPSTNEVALVSIPRDLQVKSEHGFSKINAVSVYNENKYKDEGADQTRRFFEKQFNISIPYYVRVNFKALVDAVNAVGGITVTVPRQLIDLQYPNDNGAEDKQNGPDCSGEDSSSPCRWLKVQFDIGEQMMNGERALIYARSRHGTDGNDYGRSARQQLIMIALKDKLLSAGTLTNPFKIKELYSSITNNLKTNLEINQLISLANFSRTFDRTKIRNLVLEDPALGLIVAGPQNTGLGAIEVPASGNFDQINQLIQYIFEPSALTLLEKQKKITPQRTPPPSTTSTTTGLPATTKIEIHNGTWQAGLGAQARKQLETKGFIVTATANSPKRPIDTTTLYILNQNIKPEQLSVLNKEFNAKITTTLPAWYSSTSTTTPYQKNSDVLIVIGSDFKLSQ